MSAYRFINPAMNRLLKSPWHWVMSKRLMIVSYSGRKSGREFSVPVSYYRDGSTVYCFTNGNWRYNFKNPQGATLRIRGKDQLVTGAIFSGDRLEKTELMCQYFKAVPQDRKFYGVSLDSKGSPNREQVEQATHVVDIICFTPLEK